MGIRDHCLKGIRHAALDLDGTLYKGATVFKATLPFLGVLRRLGITHSFLTNNSSKSVAEYIAQLRKMGIPVEPDELFTSTLATIEFLRAEHPPIRRLFVLGTESMRKELAGAGFTLAQDNAEGGADAALTGVATELTVARTRRAGDWVRR